MQGNGMQEKTKNGTLYIRFRKKVLLNAWKPIRLGDVAFLCAKPEIESELRELTLMKPQKKDGNLLLVDMIRVVRALKKRFPELAIELYGAPHVVVEISEKAGKPPNLPAVIAVWLLLFIGSGLAIMNFHADVSMLQVQQRIYQLITGKSSAHPLILQIPYSIGIGAGMVIFFNHIFKKKLNEEPSPLEVEMFLYEENVNQYVITEEYRKMGKQSEHPGEQP